MNESVYKRKKEKSVLNPDEVISETIGIVRQIEKIY